MQTALALTLGTVSRWGNVNGRVFSYTNTFVTSFKLASFGGRKERGPASRPTTSLNAIRTPSGLGKRRSRTGLLPPPTARFQETALGRLLPSTVSGRLQNQFSVAEAPESSKGPLLGLSSER